MNTPFRPAPFRLAVVTSPTTRRQVPGFGLGRPIGAPQHFRMSQAFDKLFKWGPATGDILRLVAHSMAGYLGYYVWMTAPKKSFPRYFGLAMGVVQTFGALCDVISLAQRSMGTHPSEGPEPASTETLKV